MWFGQKRKREEVQQTLEKVSEIQDSAKIKVQIANQEAEKLRKLIKRAAKNKDTTLTLIIAVGGDKRIE